MTADLAALPSDREAVKEFRNWLWIEHANHFVANCEDQIAAKMLAALAAAREAGARAEREAFHDAIEAKILEWYNTDRKIPAAPFKEANNYKDGYFDGVGRFAQDLRGCMNLSARGEP